MRAATLACALLLSILLLHPAPARAQQSAGSASRFEASAALAFEYPLHDGSYRTSYSPPFRFGPHAGTAGQTLTVTARRAPGFTGWFNWFPSGGRLGVQGLVNYFAADLEGSNGPYEVLLRYTALYPPDYLPRESVYRRSLAWRDTTGNLRNLALAANVVARLGDGPVSLRLSGGPTVLRTSGDGTGLGYTEFWLGGHSVLFLQQYRLAFAFEPQTGLGLDAGAALDIAVSEHVGVVVDGRYFWGPTQRAAVTLSEIINLDELISSESLAAIAQQMELPEMELDPSFLRLAGGLAIRW